MFQKLGFKKFVSISLGVLTLMLGVFFVAPSFEQKAFAVEAVIDDGGGEPLPPVCSYPAPMMGCNYEPGPSYNPMTNCGMVLSCPAPAPQVGDMIPVSNSADRSSMGDSSHANASTPVAITSNGKYVLFQSYATNLIFAGTNGKNHVFVKNTSNQSTTLISQSTAGAEGNNDSLAIAMTPDGRYILFSSLSTNLDGSDTNGQWDVFLRDTVSETTTRISKSAGGVGGNSWSMGVAISDDGRYVLFNSISNNLVAGDTNGSRDMFMRDTVSNTITRISVNDLGEQGDSDSVAVSMTPDGRYVLFTSDASTYTSNDTNWVDDIFVRDNIRHKVTQVNVNDAGDPGNVGYTFGKAFGITADGRYILFQSQDSNLVAGDTNSSDDIFVRDRTRSKTYLVNRNELGNQLLLSTPKAITADGRYVVFEDFANGNALFRRDLQTNTTVKIGGDQGAGSYQSAVGTNGKTISSNGRYILYGKNAPSNRQVYLYDAYTNTSKDVTKDASAAWGNGDSHGKLITPDGRYVLLWTKATNFTSATDTNGEDDVFVKDMLDGILYTDPNSVYKFYYPHGLQYKNPSNTASIGVVFSKSGMTYAGLAPVITVAKGASNKSLSQIVAGVTQSYRTLFRNNFTVTTEIERTAHGVPTKQLHITGKIAGVDKVYIVTFIRLLSQVYVLSANGTMSNASTLDSIVDMMVSTRKYSPIPAGVDGNPTCMFCE